MVHMYLALVLFPLATAVLNKIRFADALKVTTCSTLSHSCLSESLIHTMDLRSLACHNLS